MKLQRSKVVISVKAQSYLTGTAGNNELDAQLLGKRNAVCNFAEHLDREVLLTGCFAWVFFPEPESPPGIQSQVLYLFTEQGEMDKACFRWHREVFRKLFP